MMNTVLLPENDLSSVEDDNNSLWDEYFSLGAWPQFGFVPDVLIQPDFIQGNTP